MSLTPPGFAGDFAIPILSTLHRHPITEQHLEKLDQVSDLLWPTKARLQQRRKRPRQENPKLFTSYTVTPRLPSTLLVEVRSDSTQRSEIRSASSSITEKMATVQATSTSDPQDAYVPPPRSPKDRRFSSSKEPTSKGMYDLVSKSITTAKCKRSTCLGCKIKFSHLQQPVQPL